MRARAGVPRTNPVAAIYSDETCLPIVFWLELKLEKLIENTNPVAAGMRAAHESGRSRPFILMKRGTRSND